MPHKSTIAFIILFLVSGCTTEKKRVAPSFVTNRKPDTHFFEQVIHAKNSTEVLFYFKFNYLRNEIAIYRPDSEHTDVGVEVKKYFSEDSAYLNIDLDYFECSNKTYPEVRQKKGKEGLYESFSYSDDSKRNQAECAGSGRTFTLLRIGEDYRLVDGFMDNEERVQSLRYFIFDENPEEQYFFRFRDAEKLVSYPKEKKN